MLRAYIHGYPNLRAPAQSEWPAMNSDFTDWTTGSTNQLWPRDFYLIIPPFLTFFSSFGCIFPHFWDKFYKLNNQAETQSLARKRTWGVKACFGQMNPETCSKQSTIKRGTGAQHGIPSFLFHSPNSFTLCDQLSLFYKSSFERSSKFFSHHLP